MRYHCLYDSSHKAVVFNFSQHLILSFLLSIGLPGSSQSRSSETWDLCASRALGKFLGPPGKDEEHHAYLSPAVTHICEADVRGWVTAAEQGA